MERRRRRRRAVVAIGITASLVTGVGYGTWRFIEEREYLLEERCEVTVGEEILELTPEQARNAALLSAAAVDRGLPPEAAVHAVGISLQEEDLMLREPTEEGGSPALFARGAPSWSDSPDAQRSAVTVEGFYSALEASWEEAQEAEEAADEEDEDAESDEAAEDEEQPQHWDPQLPLDEAALALDRPYNPQFYPQHAARARAFARPLTGQQPVDMTCHLSQLDVSGPDPQGVASALVEQLSSALEIPYTEEPEDDEESDDDAEPEPILDGVIETRGSGADAEVEVSVPAADGAYDYQWMVAHWAVAVARDYGIQTVDARTYRWDRDSARWSRNGAEQDTGSTTVVLGFSRES